MSNEGNGHFPETAREQTPVTQLLESMSRNVSGSRAEVEARGEAHYARCRALHRRIIDLKEEHRRLLGDRLPADIFLAFIALLLGFGIAASIFREARTGGTG